jgi:hypothetical protein
LFSAIKAYAFVVQWSESPTLNRLMGVRLPPRVPIRLHRTAVSSADSQSANAGSIPAGVTIRVARSNGRTDGSNPSNVGSNPTQPAMGYSFIGKDTGLSSQRDEFNSRIPRHCLVAQRLVQSADNRQTAVQFCPRQPCPLSTTDSAADYESANGDSNSSGGTMRS